MATTVLWVLGIPPPVQFRGRITYDIFNINAETTTANVDDRHEITSTRRGWLFNRTALSPSHTTKIISAWSAYPQSIVTTTVNSTTETSEECNAPKRPSGKIAELGWDVFVKTLTPFLFLVVGYGLGLGVRYSTLVGAFQGGGITDSTVIPDLPDESESEDTSELDPKIDIIT